MEFWIEVQTGTVSRLTDPPVAPEHNLLLIRSTLRREEEARTSIGERYRMMSLPVDFDATFGRTLEGILSDDDEFGLYDETVWRAFRFLLLEGNVERTDDDRFRCPSRKPRT
jgi:hypothetical protein